VKNRTHFCTGKTILLLTVTLASCFFIADAAAQGFATWLGERVGLGDAGRAIDDANREAKRVIPLYGQVEDAVTQPIRHIVTESVVETTAPILKNLILLSRNDALSAGATPLPPEVVWEFSGFYSQEVLSVYWRVGQGHDLSLQANAFRYGDRAAIVLDTVMVFRSWSDANSVWLWAHELAHVEQYRAWGIDDFTKRYIRDYAAIENEANRRADEFMAFRNRRISQMPPQPIQQQAPQNGTMCVTAVNACPWFGPVGWSCICASPAGLQQGMIR
jgi:Domain of unknown function (DUF4157)